MGYDDIKYFVDKFYPDMPERTRNKIKDGMFELMEEHTLKLKGDAFDIRDGISAADEPNADDAKPDDDTKSKTDASTEGDGDDLNDDKADLKGTKGEKK
ncbi:MAG: hypothetical protein LBH43_11970 [Treponema sp.]|jgi:hypothetical protein|nr:hypothetical protein [Treponema sp.]